MLGRWNLKVVVQLLVDVFERAGERPHVWQHGEGEAMCVSRRGIRILPEDDDANVLKIACCEGGELVLSRRQHGVLRPLGIDKGLQLGKVRLRQLVGERRLPRRRELPAVGIGGGHGDETACVDDGATMVEGK